MKKFDALHEAIRGVILNEATPHYIRMTNKQGETFKTKHYESKSAAQDASYKHFKSGKWSKVDVVPVTQQNEETIVEQMVPALITHKHGTGSINVPDHPNFGSKEHLDAINKHYPDMPSGPVTKVERDTRKTKTPEEIGKEQIADRERNRYHGD